MSLWSEAAIPIHVKGNHPATTFCAGRLEAAVARVADFLNRATKPVLVAGAHMRSARARAAMVALAEASGGRYRSRAGRVPITLAHCACCSLTAHSRRPTAVCCRRHARGGHAQ